MSASGTKQTFLFAPPMSATGGKADIARSAPNVPQTAFMRHSQGHLLQLNAFDFAKLRQTTMDYD